MAQLTLRFSQYRSISLDAVQFSHPNLKDARVSYRGKGFSELLCRHTFQWTPAVRALSVLMLRTKAGYISHSGWPASGSPTIAGEGGSMAASLDYALSKRPLWMLDMFGTTANGEAIVKMLFARWNSERKRGGAVVVAVNPSQLSAEGIVVLLNGSEIDAERCVKLADSILLSTSNTAVLELTSADTCLKAASAG